MFKYQSANVIIPANKNTGCLLLGDTNAAVDYKLQKKYKIKTIISLGHDAAPSKDKQKAQIAYYIFDLHHNKQQIIKTELFDEICSKIHKGRQQSCGVLVHCYAGVARSSTFTIAYLMKQMSLGYLQAYQYVKSKRTCICPSDFIKYLQNYAKVLKIRNTPQEQVENKLEQFHLPSQKQNEKSKVEIIENNEKSKVEIIENKSPIKYIAAKGVVRIVQKNNKKKDQPYVEQQKTIQQTENQSTLKESIISHSILAKQIQKISNPKQIKSNSQKAYKVQTKSIYLNRTKV